MNLIHCVLKKLVVVSLMAVLLLSSGCGGCNSKPVTKKNAAAKKKKKKKPKPNFQTQTPVVLPGYYPMDPAEREKLEEEAKKDEKKRQELNRMDPAFRNNRVKRGHWTSVDFLTIANNFDTEGSFESYPTSSTSPRLLEGSDYFISTQRPFALTKGDWKKLETSVFIPRATRDSLTTGVRYRLGNGGSIPFVDRIEIANVMEAWQHHVVVLSNRFNRFGYLKVLDCMTLRSGVGTGTGHAPRFYSVVPTLAGDPIPLPSNSMNWSTIAYIIWDDLDPNSLSIEQQNAMIDWLHFGGQIIFSGPDCIDSLQSSFLADWLPGKFEETAVVTRKDIEDLNRSWAIPKKIGGKRTLNLPDKQPLSIIRFRPHVDAEFIRDSNELALERRVGRGRVVATSFSLVDQQITSWTSFASFFHNALMRKPSRVFAKTSEGEVSYRYENDRTNIYDPLAHSTVRFLSRDIASSPKAALQAPTAGRRRRVVDFSFQGEEQDPFLVFHGKNVGRDREDVFHYGGYQSKEQSGVAGWNDHSGIANAARRTLKRAARIKPPDSGFVLKMLGCYLLVLVPINWLIFRLMGRVEWAWIAAPLISIIGAVAVVRMASLDIGFVRSVTHVGVLELHGDYPRGHLTDYSALYTSLSTGYRVELDNNSGQTMPFSNRDEGAHQRGESFTKVTLNRSGFSVLDNFLVRSNSTGLMHTESVLDAGGTFSLQKGDASWVVSNNSFVNVEGCGVIRRNKAGKLEVAWIGNLDAGTASPQLRFAAVEGNSAEGLLKVWQKSGQASNLYDLTNRVWDEVHNGMGKPTVSLDQLATSELLRELWPQVEQALQVRVAIGDETYGEVSREMLSDVIQEVAPSDDIGVSELLGCLMQNLMVGKGEVRLVGQSSQKLDRTQFIPKATQVRQELLVVVHLQAGEMTPCRRDANAYGDFILVDSNIEQEEFLKQFDEENSGKFGP